MKPQQQDIQAKAESHVYAQMPDGTEVHIQKEKEQSEESPEAAKQTAENTPTTASSEVTSGDGG